MLGLIGCKSSILHVYLKFFLVLENRILVRLINTTAFHLLCLFLSLLHEIQPFLVSVLSEEGEKRKEESLLFLFLGALCSPLSRLISSEFDICLVWSRKTRSLLALNDWVSLHWCKKYINDLTGKSGGIFTFSNRLPIGRGPYNLNLTTMLAAGRWRL